MPVITEQEVKSLLEQALKKLIEDDSYLLEHDLHERTITHKLAEYLQPLFPDWNVDCEYNRDGHDPKRVDLNIDLAPEEQWDAGSKVYPDIIIHHRGNNDHNLLIIEAKKRSQFDGCIDDYDQLKIEAFKASLKYSYGAAITIRKGQENGGRFEIFFYSENNWSDPLYL